jgi:serpin B
MFDPGDLQFSCALLDRLRGGEGNLCFSPLAVRVVFAICYAGARGTTAEEMRRVFRFGNPEGTSRQFATLLGKLAARGAQLGPPVPQWAQGGDGPVLRVASRLWGALGRPLMGDFAEVAARAFGAPLERLDFGLDVEGSRAKINAWVAEATEGKVTELVAPGQVDSATSLVTTSAAYLRARWATPFPEAATQEAPFSSPRGSVMVPTMRQVAQHSYGVSDGVRVLELPYAGGQLAMRVAVPADERGLDTVERHAEKLMALPLRAARLRLSMPRFRCTSRFALEGPLSEMGLASVFRYGLADLSGIDGTRELYVSRVVHEVLVNVDEQGTEAAAATALVARAGAAAGVEPIIDVRIDRPFLFWIVDRPTGTVLFGGRVSDPSAS